jgi:hypothetical protein
MNMLIRLLEDAAPVVRASAANALAHMGDAAIAAAPTLRRCLDDEEVEVRKAGCVRGWQDTRDGWRKRRCPRRNAQASNPGDRLSAMHALDNIAQLVGQKPPLKPKERVLSAISGCTDKSPKRSVGGAIDLKRTPTLYRNPRANRLQVVR